VSRIARIIAEAGVRLRVDGKGLALEIRQVIRKAMTEAQAAQVDLPSPTRGMAADADRDADRMDASLKKITGSLLGVARGAASAVLSGTKLLLIGTAAVGALAGVTQLTIGVAALVGAALQAAGVLGILPAALVAVKVVTAAVTLGLSSMSDAFSAIASGDAAAFDEATKNMAASARDFALAAREVKPALDQMRLDTQQALFDGLSDVVRPLAEAYLPLVSEGFQGIARSTNGAAREVADFLLQGQQVEAVRSFLDNVNVGFGNLASAARPVVSALIDIVNVGSNQFPRMTQAVEEWANAFATRVRSAAESGALDAFFQRSIAAVQQLGRIFGNVFEGIRNIMAAADSVGGGFLATIEQITAKFAEFTGGVQGFTAFQSFFSSMQRVVDALGPAFFELLTVIGTGLLPILADIASIIGPILLPIFQAFGRLLEALRPVFIAVANAVATAMEALIPFFDALGRAIDSAMPTLGPIIQDIGEAFGELFEAMVPLAPLFVDLLEAILPVIPPLIRMLAEIMPELIELVQAFVPLIQAWADMMVLMIPIITDFVNFLLNVFVPVISFVISVIAGILNVITTVATGAWDVITTVFSAIGNFFSGIWEDITSQVSSFWNTISGLFSGGTEGVKSTLSSWGNSIWSTVQAAMSNIGNAISGGVRNAVGYFNDFVGSIFNSVGELPRKMFQAGLDTIGGLLNGLRAKAGEILAFFRNLINNAVNSVLDALGIASPSKVFAEIGKEVGNGFIAGLTGITPAVIDAADAMARAVVEAASFAPQVTLSAPTDADLLAARRVGESAPVIQQTNIMRPGTDVMQFATTVLQRGYGDMLTGASTLAVRRNPVQAGVDDQLVNL
jgi:phage-related protein